MIKIVVNKNSRAIKILAPIFHDELSRNGCKNKIVYSDNLNKTPVKAGDIFFVLAPHKFKSFERTAKNIKATYIMYQQEHLSNKHKTGRKRIIQLKSFINKYDYIVDVSEINKPIYTKFGRKIDFILPTAYHKYFEYSSLKPRQEKYQCLFFGRFHDKPRRRKILKPLMNKFVFYPKLQDIYGKNLEKAIRDSRIILNIHQDNVLFPEWLRIILAIANHKLLITEPTNNIEPLIKNKHIVFASTKEMAQKIYYYLDHKGAYQKIVNSAYAFAKTNYRMDIYIKKFVHHFANIL
jgi:hypothetical protein